MKILGNAELSSKKQVTLPASVCKTLKLRAGAQFVIFTQGDVVMLKLVTPPPQESMDVLMKEARKEARKIGLRKSDIKAAIVEARQQARKQK